MLKYTVAACNKIVSDLKRLSHVFTVVVQSLMIVYMAYSAIVNNGSRAINIALGALTLVNLVVYLIFNRRNDKKSKRFKGAVSRGYIVFKLSLNAISLASVIYSIYVGASNVSGLTLVITPLMIIMWVLQVLFQLAKAYAENRFALFVDGLKMDFEFVISPVKKVKNAVHDFFGEEREEESGVSEKNRAVLTHRAEEDGLVKKQKRREKLISRFNVIKKKLIDATMDEPEREEADEPSYMS